MLKKGMLGAAFALLVAGAGAFAQKQQVMLDKVVAVVGSSSILHSEVAEYARQLTAQRRAEGYTSDRDPMNEALEALMTQKLLADRLGEDQCGRHRHACGTADSEHDRNRGVDPQTRGQAPHGHFQHPREHAPAL